MRRREVMRLLGAAALSPQAKAWARPSTALKGSAGRLKQSACRWPYRAIPLPDLCRAAAKMGLAGIDLLRAAEGGSGEDTAEIPAPCHIVCRLFLLKKKKKTIVLPSHMTH